MPVAAQHQVLVQDEARVLADIWKYLFAKTNNEFTGQKMALPFGLRLFWAVNSLFVLANRYFHISAKTLASS